MTSSIYPLSVSTDFVGIVGSLTINNGGTGFTSAPTLTIDPPSGTTALATSTINGAGIVSSITVTNEGAGYTSTPTVTIAAPVSGVTATATANLSDGKVISITITDAGSGYTSAPTVTIAAPAPGVTATATATTDGDAIDSVTITLSGSGYTSIPNVVVTGGGGSGADITATIASLGTGADILSNDITIISDHVKPGGGGILRLYFSFILTPSTGTIGVFNNSVFKGNLNADNSSEINTDGYYRFDIDVEKDDNINLQLKSGTGGDSLSPNFIRAHLVQFGA